MIFIYPQPKITMTEFVMIKHAFTSINIVRYSVCGLAVVFQQQADALRPSAVCYLLNAERVFFTFTVIQCTHGETYTSRCLDIAQTDNTKTQNFIYMYIKISSQVGITKHIYTSSTTVSVPSFRIGTPPTLSRKRVFHPPELKEEGTHSPAGEGVGGPNWDAQKKPIYSTLWCG